MRRIYALRIFGQRTRITVRGGSANAAAALFFSLEHPLPLPSFFSPSGAHQNWSTRRPKPPPPKKRPNRRQPPNLPFGRRREAEAEAGGKEGDCSTFIKGRRRGVGWAGGPMERAGEGRWTSSSLWVRGRLFSISGIYVGLPCMLGTN